MRHYVCVCVCICLWNAHLQMKLAPLTFSKGQTLKIYVFLQCSLTNLWVHNRASGTLTLLLVKTWNDVWPKSFKRKLGGYHWELDLKTCWVVARHYGTRCLWEELPMPMECRHKHTHMHCKLHIVIPHAHNDTLFVGYHVWMLKPLLTNNPQIDRWILLSL